MHWYARRLSVELLDLMTATKDKAFCEHFIFLICKISRTNPFLSEEKVLSLRVIQQVTTTTNHAQQNSTSLCAGPLWEHLGRFLQVKSSYINHSTLQCLFV